MPTQRPRSRLEAIFMEIESHRVTVSTANETLRRLRDLLLITPSDEAEDTRRRMHDVEMDRDTSQAIIRALEQEVRNYSDIETLGEGMAIMPGQVSGTASNTWGSMMQTAYGHTFDGATVSPNPRETVPDGEELAHQISNTMPRRSSSILSSRAIFRRSDLASDLAVVPPNDPDQVAFRPLSLNPDDISKAKKGEIVKSKRPFGIELEIVSSHLQAPKLSRSIPEHVGIAHDGSINSFGSGQGFEIQTPPAGGDRAETLIKDICAQLKKHKAKVNTSCGYHIHINMQDLDLKERTNPGIKFDTQKNIWAFYLVFEDVLMSFMPTNRRNNRYCKTLRDTFSLKNVSDCQSPDQLYCLWYGCTRQSLPSHLGESKDGTRYRGVNLHTMFARGHTEIRFHSGTTNERKILEWANLHCRIADLGAEGVLRRVNYGQIYNLVDLKEKTAKMFEILGLSKINQDYFRARQDKFAQTGGMDKIAPETMKEVEELLALEPENV